VIEGLELSAREAGYVAYLVVPLTGDQLFPRPYQHVQSKPEEEVVIVLSERVLDTFEINKRPQKPFLTLRTL
jgi:hypothetical protein